MLYSGGTISVKDKNTIVDMELKIYFDENEIIDLLTSKGYTIETVTGWESRTVYHNDVEFEDVPVLIAYKTHIGKPDKKELGESAYWLQNKYGINNVFLKEIKQRLKTVLFNDKLW